MNDRSMYRLDIFTVIILAALLALWVVALISTIMEDPSISNIIGGSFGIILISTVDIATITLLLKEAKDDKKGE